MIKGRPDQTWKCSWIHCAQIENILCGTGLCDKLRSMAVLTRLFICALTLVVATLAPTVPDQISTAKRHHLDCCAWVNMNGCSGSPTNAGGANSSSASTCCNAQSGCVTLYFASATPPFVRETGTGMAIGAADQRVTSRFQRPEVPPPRRGLV